MNTILKRQHTLYSTITFAAATTRYRFFDTQITSMLLSNQQLPGADSQIMFVDRIKLFLNYPARAANMAVIANILLNSVIQIFVNQREKIRIPLCECVNFEKATTLGNDATPPPIISDLYQNERPLLQPIAFNMKDNVEVNLLTNATVSAALAALTGRIELSGILYTRQSNEGWEKVIKSIYPNTILREGYEVLDYTFFDAVTPTAAAATNNFFIQAVKTDNTFSKFLPLSLNESFRVLAMQLVDTFTGVTLSTALSERMSQVVRVMIDNIEVLRLADLRMHQLLGANTGTFADAGPVNTNYASIFSLKNIKELEEPLLIPASGQVEITLQQGAMTGLGGGTMLKSILLKGLLTRKVV